MVPKQVRDAIFAQAAFCSPEECCGLLAGATAAVVDFVYPLTNAEASPVAYTIDPYEHYRAFKHAEASGWDLIGAFHSHPQGPDHPSPTDLRLAAEPDWTYLIVSGKSLRGYRIRSATYTEVRLVDEGQDTATGRQ
ncbi:MAG: M67 family metallopeptidase [Acidimicrobiia bacterium]|nr:M67 family metallopeptidase [Acidimicrobiia bacterium]